MGRQHRLPCAAALAALALLALAGTSACGIADPSPALRGQTSNGGTEGAATMRGGAPTQLLLRLGERRLYLVDDDPATPVESFPVAIGRQGWETPVGQFHIEEMVEHPDFLKLDPAVPARVIKWIPPGPTNPLGERWIGFAHGEGWTIGIHGTPNPELLGQAVSHGCVRMRNEDVVRIYGRVRLGTTVLVEP
jgi:lipoprotein-anchoring transpeptidase ErfK/SrfK